MINETLARRYATAIFSTAKDAGAVDEVGTALQRMLDALQSDDTIHRFYYAPIIDRAEKAKVLRAAFEGKVHEVALHSVLLLVRKRREALLSAIVEQYDRLTMAEHGFESLVITSARELSNDQATRLIGRLESHYGKKFEVEQRTDPRLIGGIRITMGDRTIDGTVAGRLSELSRSLFN